MTVEASATTGEGVSLYGFRDSGGLYHHRYVLPAIEALWPCVAPCAVLDAGCGNGALSAWLAGKGHDVTGVDIAADGISLARADHQGPRFERRSVYDDLTDLAPDHGWDVIVSSEVIEHLFAPMRFLANLAGLLRPGGHLIITTPYHGYVKNLALSLTDGWDRHFHVENEGGHIKFFSTRSLSRALSRAGFADFHFCNAGRAPYLWKSLVCRATRPG